MSHVSRQSKFAFLAVTEVTNLGFCGGLLILNLGGRPVEFHCTAPVSPNRAQEILYGATLKEFITCDQIAASLLDKAKTKPHLILIDDRDISKLSVQVDIPVIFVQDMENNDRVESDADSNIELEIAEQRLTGYGDHDFEGTESLLKLFMETLPISEPFDRIYEAIREAHKEAA